MKKLLASIAISALVALPVASQNLGRQAEVAVPEVLEVHLAVRLAVLVLVLVRQEPVLRLAQLLEA